MTKEKLKEVIECIINDAFNRIEYAYLHHCENSPKTGHDELTRLVFPSYANGDTRISEQELRFAFVEAFNKSKGVKEHNLFYSIETPTRRRYKGFAKGKPEVVQEGQDDGRSAAFDLVVFDDKLNRICLIEFKAKTASESNHKKDLLKLKTEGDGVLRYFIEVEESYHEGTIKSLHNKVFSKGGYNEDKKTEFRCYVLKSKDAEGNLCGEIISEKVINYKAKK